MSNIHSPIQSSSQKMYDSIALALEGVKGPLADQAHIIRTNLYKSVDTDKFGDWHYEAIEFLTEYRITFRTSKLKQAEGIMKTLSRVTGGQSIHMANNIRQKLKFAIERQDMEKLDKFYKEGISFLTEYFKR